MAFSILFVATQYGSLNIISPLIEACLARYRVGYMGVKQIPNRRLIFNQAILEDDEPVFSSLGSYDLYVTGTSPTSDFEYKIWKYAAERKVKSICLLDSSKYAIDRFRKGGVTFYPDIICVTDDQVKDIVLSVGVEANRVIVAGSPYFDRIGTLKISEIEKHRIKDEMNASTKKIITFCTEYIAQKGEKDRYGYDELSVLDDLAQYISCRGADKFRLAVRVHPNDSKEIYKQYLKSVTDGIEWDIISEDNDRRLFQISDVVIGMTSLILVEAVILGIPAISYQPADTATKIQEYDSMANIELITSKEDLFISMDRDIFNFSMKAGRQVTYRNTHSLEKIMGLIRSSLFKDGGIPA